MTRSSNKCSNTVLLLILLASFLRAVLKNDYLPLTEIEQRNFKFQQTNKNTNTKSSLVIHSTPDKNSSLVNVPIPPIANRLASILSAAPRTSWLDTAQYVHDQVLSEGLLTEKAPPKSGSITLAAGFWDYRQIDPNTNKHMGLSFDDDVERFIAGAVSLSIPKILFVDLEVYLRVHSMADEENTRFVIITLDKLKAYLGNAFDDIVKIQSDNQWVSQAGWLSTSPQAKCPSYNLMGFSKIFLLREASRMNPFHTKSFLWVDGRNECLPHTPLIPDSLDVFNEHFDRFFATYFNYEVTGEVHGFPRKQFLKFAGADNSQIRFKILKGTIFGGKAAHIETISIIFDIFMRATLAEGAMGVDECVWAVVAYRYPRLFHLFSNDNSCGESTAYDHVCDGYRNGALQCAVYDWAAKGPPSRNGGRWQS